MAADCIIENWAKRNKSWLGFLACIVGVWALSVVGIITIKHYYTGLSWQNSRISLSNILSLGSAIGAIAVVVFAWVAYDGYWRQKKDNEVFAKLIEFIDLINSDLLHDKF